MPRSVPRRASVAAAALLALPAAARADFDYPTFTGATTLSLVGAASTTSALILTPNAGFEAGAAWHATKQQVAGGFETTFRFRLVSAGADGMAFVVQNDAASAIGLCGGSLGYSSGNSACPTSGQSVDLANALVVEIDCWNNPDYADPNDNHVSVHMLQSSDPFAHSNNALATATPAFDLNDGAPHTVRVVYDGTVLDVYADDLVTPLISIPLDYAGNATLDAGTAWVGFTGATGGAQQTHAVLDWSFGEAIGLFSDTTQISALAGGTAQLTLIAGATYAGLPYLLLGSLSGTSPGVPIDPLSTLPLNVDSYLLHTLQNANAPPLAGSFGLLDASGRGSATFTLPQSTNPVLVGLIVDHAFVVVELLPGLLAVPFVSNPVPIAITP